MSKTMTTSNTRKSFGRREPSALWLTQHEGGKRARLDSFHQYEHIEEVFAIVRTGSSMPAGVRVLFSRVQAASGPII